VPEETSSYVGFGLVPPAYPETTSVTPSRFRNGGCMHQKQPPANVAFFSSLSMISRCQPAERERAHPLVRINSISDRIMDIDFGNFQNLLRGKRMCFFEYAGTTAINIRSDLIFDGFLRFMENLYFNLPSTRSLTINSDLSKPCSSVVK